MGGSTLHDIEVAYLSQGADLAITVACVRLHGQGTLQCEDGKLHVVGSPVAGHPVERGVLETLDEDITWPRLWIRMRASDEIEAVRRRLIDLRLLRVPTVLRRNRRTRAGERALRSADGAGNGTARRVALGEIHALRRASPELADALGLGTPPCATWYLSGRRSARGRHAAYGCGAFVDGGGGDSSCGGDGGCGGGGCGGGGCGGD